MRQRLSILVILALMLASAVLPAARIARAAELSVVAVGNGEGGSLLLATGAGFAANSYVALWWDNSTGEAAAIIMTDAEGSFIGVRVTAPPTTGNVRLLYASDGATTVAAIVGGVPVATLTVNSASAIAGGTASVSGEHFTPGAVVSIYWDAPGGTALGSVATDAAGAFTHLTVIIPATASAGAHTLHALDNQRYASSPLTVTIAQATLAVSPTAQVAGGWVAAAGAGFAAGETVSLRWESAAGAELVSAATDSTGAFASVPLTIPTAAAAGAHTIIGLGSASLRQAATSVTVTVADSPVGVGWLTGTIENAVTGGPIAGAAALLQPALPRGTDGQNGLAGPPQDAPTAGNGGSDQNGGSGQPGGSAAGQNGIAGPPDSVPTVQTAAAADGSFSFTGLTPGTYRLQVSASGFRSRTIGNITVLAGIAATVHVALQPTGTPDERRSAGQIGGRVTDQATDVPIRKATVLFIRTGDDDDHRRGHWFGITRTDGDGVYRKRVLPGTYTVIAMARGYQSERVEQVTVSDGGAVRVPFTLEARADRSDDTSDDNGADPKDPGKNRKPGNVGPNGAATAPNGLALPDEEETNGSAGASAAATDKDGRRGKEKARQR